MRLCKYTLLPFHLYATSKTVFDMFSITFRFRFSLEPPKTYYISGNNSEYAVYSCSI